jgi:hypothetical protein
MTGKACRYTGGYWRLGDCSPYDKNLISGRTKIKHMELISKLREYGFYRWCSHFSVSSLHSKQHAEA